MQLRAEFRFEEVEIGPRKRLAGDVVGVETHDLIDGQHIALAAESELELLAVETQLLVEGVTGGDQHLLIPGECDPLHPRLEARKGYRGFEGGVAHPHREARDVVMPVQRLFSAVREHRHVAGGEL